VNVETGEVLGLPFVAYLDLIEKNGDGLIVVDLKTAGRSYAQADVDANLQTHRVCVDAAPGDRS